MKQRIISGTVATILLVVTLFFRDTLVFPIMFALLGVMAMWEIFVSTKLVRNLPIITVSILFAMTVPFFTLPSVAQYATLICVLFALAFFGVCLYQYKKIQVREIYLTFALSIIIPFALSSLLWLNSLPVFKSEIYKKPDGLFFLLLALGGAWISDTGAYFTGVFLGKHKLCPEISPKKTVEGAIGGVVSNILFYLIMGLIWSVAVLDKKGYIQFGWIILLAAVISVVSIIGDLTFSVIKRECDIKDYGNIMPGHGGVLDRFDSIIFVAPVMYTLIKIFPIIVR